jgi:hypothetical protein
MKIRAYIMEDIPKSPYLSSFLKFKGTKLKKKKVQSKEFLGRVVWLTTQEFKVQTQKQKK